MTIQQLVQRHYAEVNANDYSDAAEIFSPDVLTQPPGSAPLRWIEPFVAYGKGFSRAFPDGRIHGDRYVESGDVAVVEGRVTRTNTGPLESPAGTLPATGRPMGLPFARVFRVADRAVRRHRIR